MADGTQDQVSDQPGEPSDQPGEPEEAPPAAAAEVTGRLSDTGRVARIVAALRTAHAEQAARSAASADEAPDAAVADATVADDAPDAAVVDTAAPEPLTPRRETSGVRAAEPTTPTLRWNPGVRYRASQLANQQAAASAAVPGPVPLPPVPLPPVPLPPVPAPPAGAPQPLAGRLFRGPARRTAVFEREIWYPATRSSRVPSDVGEALVAAVERYRKGSISTSGLVRAIGSAHAA
ncbi:hypothetical protein GCM10010413_33170 [Promicromonospora sukumoe]|uniref:Uncharacterized protein n=1 Tax=Promicromonospora sukumoe TaxID=88382 RepID=A0A7W3J852_9MICO|nr:hypothetical protein [Promicromonospora sukumoe]MBA8808071.1 hypothetical protein [Promicromonospora sukumoe]